MTQPSSMRISDPESLIARTEQALAAIEAIEEIVVELQGAKGRLAQLEQSLKGEISSSEAAAKQARQVALDSSDEAKKALERLAAAQNSLQADWQRERTRLNVAESELRAGAETTLGDVVSKTDSALERLDAAAAQAARAAEEARTENEAFRKEQLTKLDDLLVSHSLLSNRQRDHEQQTERALEDQRQRVNGLGELLHRSVESLQTQVRDCVAELQAIRVSQDRAVDELKSRDAELNHRVTRASRIGIVLVASTWVLLGAAAAAVLTG